MAVASTALGMQVYRVNASAGSGGDGLTWSTAFADLSLALAVAAANAPAQVWVVQGTYRPDQNTDHRELSFSLAPGVEVYGGFEGTESSVSQREPTQFLTVLSGDIGAPHATDDNSRHVVVAPSSTNASTVLDGFTIQGGNANGTGYPNEHGGGILVDGGSPLIRNCVVRFNSARYGGGMYTRIGSPSIVGCLFGQNSASGDGGGLDVNGSVEVRGCIFDGNRSNFGGGAVMCCGTSRVVDSRFTGNFANTGGGLFSPIGTLAVVRCEFEGNSGGSGGGMNSSSSGSTLSIVATTFTGNSATQGGGLYLTNAPLLFDCVLSRNTSMQRGGGLYLQGSATLTNCTVFSNWSLTQGGGMYAASGTPAIANTVLWSNADTQSSLQASQLSSAVGTWSVNFSCVQGWTGSIVGVGNTSSPPVFVDPVGADRRLGTGDDTFFLLPGSSCIDAGDASLVPLDQWDLDGDGDVLERAPLDFAGAARLVDDPDSSDSGAGAPPHVDIGAFEHQALCAADFDGSGFVDIDDYIAFMVAFDAGQTAADYDGSGFVDLDDFDAFVREFEEGC